MKKIVYAAKVGNVVVPIRGFRNKGYLNFVLSDYSTGSRRLRTFADLEEAKAEADRIAESIAAGCGELASVPPNELITAWHFWREHRPQGLKPLVVSAAIFQFSGRRDGKLGVRGARLADFHWRVFEGAFSSRLLHEVTSVELSDLVARRGWQPKASNDFLKNVAMLFSDAIQRGHALVNIASANVIKRQRVKHGEICIFSPAEVRQLLSGIDDELKPVVAMWCFSGIRKEEISKLSWRQVHEGIASGHVYLRAAQSKTGIARAVVLEPNLMRWLQRYPQTDGQLLPVKCKVDSLTGILSKQSGLAWRDNAPRHSFGTYSLARGDAPAAVAAMMGNGLAILQGHYWARSRNVTKEEAAEWFGIVPE
jgi:integrase